MWRTPPIARRDDNVGIARRKAYEGERALVGLPLAFAGFRMRLTFLPTSLRSARVAVVVLALLPACQEVDRLPTAPPLAVDRIGWAADVTEVGPNEVVDGRAALTLSASASILQTGDVGWTLDKSGSLSGNTVTWTITATEIATTSGLLLLEGLLTVTNTGDGPAPIGNIVVNLQKRVSNMWVTKSSNVADATNGEAATTASIHPQASSEGLASFTENGASGTLNFMDATNNTVFSLVPQVMIGAGETRSLRFSAEFNNNNAALQLTPGTPIRAEVIVSFGNATANGNSTANVDINGNGTIDADEGRIRSVPSRLTLTVPAPVNGNGSVTLTDTADDISATGDVTFSNVVINLGATTGTVTANVSGGTNGGSITNCAHLTGNDQNVSSGGLSFPIVNGVDLQACSTVTVAGSPTCTPGAPGCGWELYDMQTAPQAAWGDGASIAGSLLSSNFDGFYPADLVAGGTNTLRFTSAAAVHAYLPAAGTPAGLTLSLQDPITTSSGELGGEVLGLKLNVDFSALLGNAVALGDLRICNFASVPVLNGQTVTQFLATANHVLGGGSASIGPTAAAAVARFINGAFTNGVPSTFAENNLVAGNCPSN